MFLRIALISAMVALSGAVTVTTLGCDKKTEKKVKKVDKRDTKEKKIAKERKKASQSASGGTRMSAVVEGPKRMEKALESRARAKLKAQAKSKGFRDVTGINVKVSCATNDQCKAQAYGMAVK